MIRRIASSAIQAGGLYAALALIGCQNQMETRDQTPSEMDDDGMMGGHDMMGHGRTGEMMGQMMGETPQGMMSGEMRMDPTMMRDMHVIHGLLMSHGEIRREVEDIPGGVRTVTTSSVPEVTQAIRTHVRQMKCRIEEGRSIRRMDPLFREIFQHHDEIEMRVEDVPGGVRVVETSEDPQVTLLIRQHARRAVSEFVEGGMRRAMRPTPLPEGYER